MARSGNLSRPGRSLLGLLALLIALFGTVAAGVVTSNGASFSPKLALDLEGGTEIVLTPVPVGGTPARSPRPRSARP